MIFYLIAILDSPLSLTYCSNSKIDIGSLVKVKVRNYIKDGVILKEVEKPTFKAIEIDEVSDFYLPQNYLKIAEFISKYYFCEIGFALKIFNFFKKNQIYIDEKIETAIKLSNEQQKAFDFISKNSTSLLFGDTGSGKTEIYIKKIEEMINQNQSSILLMPEISLTPQIEKRLKEHFGELVAIWHSKVTKKSKEKILNRIYKGEVKIVAGARSSLFLPLLNLGLIIVDEEHDDSYKSNQKPRINARDLAIYFAKALNIKAILGSATPNLTSYQKFPTFRLKGQYFKSKKDVFFENSEINISDFILNQIDLTLRENSQIIIFLPTRANFKYLFCESCQSNIKCPNCSVGLSLHKSKNALVCHYCNYSSIISQECPTCNSELSANRMGTSEVVEILKEHFPENIIKKFDRDEIKSEKDLRKRLSDFNSGEIDILVGTQMLSKGHDYHRVNLALILGIDSILSMSDFRSSEKALALITQIAGRSGRKRDGKVIIQTQDSHFFKSYIGKYEQFLKDETPLRENLYPPFTKLIRVLFSHKDKKKAFEQMNLMVQNLQKFPDIEIVGFKEAEIEKIANKYRYNILLRGNNINSLINSAIKSKTKYCEIDIDPISFS